MSDKAKISLIYLTQSALLKTSLVETGIRFYWSDTLEKLITMEGTIDSILLILLFSEYCS